MSETGRTRNMALLISRRAWGRGAFLALVIALVFFATCLILLGSTVDFIVDWLWFSAIGYLSVFWTVIVAESRSLPCSFS